MRKRAVSVEEVKQRISGLKGSSLKISVNKGRKRVLKYDGEIAELYPAVFTLKITSDKHVDLLSFSYSDVICGDIKLTLA
ncbi:MAG: hypothetical protein HFE48_05280 [Clostridia bacterium]|nr:hypothetical protein [Clostridia bacterium]